MPKTVKRSKKEKAQIIELQNDTNLLEFPALTDKWRLRITFRDRVAGGLPKNPKSITAMLKKKGLDEDEAVIEHKEIEEYLLDKDGASAEIDERRTTFKCDHIGIYMEPRHLRASTREGATTLRITQRVRGWRDACMLGMIWKPERFYIQRNGEVVTKADGYDVVTHDVFQPGKGKVGIVKFQDFVAGSPYFDATVYVTSTLLQHSTTHEFEQGGKIIRATGAQLLRLCWLQACEGGMGAGRAGDLGRFDMEFLETPFDEPKKEEAVLDAEFKESITVPETIAETVTQ